MPTSTPTHGYPDARNGCGADAQPRRHHAHTRLMPGTRYTDTQRAEAITLCAQHGIAHTHRETGIPKTTLSRWCQDAGVDLGRAVEKTRAATEASKASLEARKTALAAGLLDDIEKLRSQLFAPCTARQVVTVGDGKGYSHAEIVVVEQPEPTFAEKKQIMTSIAIAVDKVQILTGGATSRHEVVDDLRQTAVTMIDELAARRAKKQAA